MTTPALSLPTADPRRVAVEEFIRAKAAVDAYDEELAACRQGVLDAERRYDDVALRRMGVMGALVIARRELDEVCGIEVGE